MPIRFMHAAVGGADVNVNQEKKKTKHRVPQKRLASVSESTAIKV
jgi:hypothetical protein